MTTRVVAASSGASVVATVTSAGDLRADGSVDLLLAIYGPGHHSVEARLNSRTGHLHRLTGLVSAVAHVTRRSRSALAVFTQTGDVLRVVTEPATGAAYWKDMLRVPKNYDPAATSLHASTKRCSDVLVEPANQWPFGVAAMYSGSGHLLWTLRTGSNALFGGKVHDVKPPAHLCAA